MRDFIEAGRNGYQMAAFVAVIDGKVVGSVACQLRARLRHERLTPDDKRNTAGRLSTADRKM